MSKVIKGRKGKRLPWEDVRADVCRHYLGDGKSRKTLEEVQSIMLLERGFYASIRAYRLRLRDWNSKLVDTAKPNTRTNWNNSLFPQTQQASIFGKPCDLNVINARSQDENSSNIVSQQIHTGSAEFDGNLLVEYHDVAERQRLAHANVFDDILQRALEARSVDSLVAVLQKDDFYSTDSTFLHYVAAKGRMTEFLKEVLQFCKHHNHPVDARDQNRSTPLHVAIQNDRTDNALVLLDFGASPTLRDPTGELPLHLAIMYCGDPRLVEVLCNRFRDGAKMQVQSPSAKQGQIALDLVVNRLLLEEASFTRTTKKMLFEIMKITPTIQDNTYLQQHVFANWTLFMQAVTAVGHLPFGQDLKNTMIQIVHTEEQAWKRFYRYTERELAS